MEELRIMPQDIAGKGVTGLPDTPGLTAGEMQRKLDELALEVLIPKHNALVQALAEPGGASYIGWETNGLSGHLTSRENPHAVTAGQTGAYTKSETDAAIAQKVADIASADMAAAVYDADGDGVVDDARRLGGVEAGGYAKKEDGMTRCVHAFENGAHVLRGAGEKNGALIFTAEASYRKGEAFFADGRACSARTSGGDFLEDDAFLQGAEVFCLKREDRLYFRPGGGEWRYRVLASAVLPPPETSEENDIVVLTQTPISGVVFSGERPGQTMEQGQVWLYTGGYAGTAFNAGKRHRIMLCPCLCMQMEGASPVQKTAYLLKEGHWVRIGRFFLDKGNVYAAQTGGFAAVDGTSAGAVLPEGIAVQAQEISCCGMASLSPVPLADIRTLYIAYAVTQAEGSSRSHVFGVHDARSCRYTHQAQGWAAEYRVQNPPLVQEAVAALDVSALNGAYYLLAGSTCGSASAQTTLIKQIWGE